MAFNYPTVTIASKTYTAYVDLDTADEYLAASAAFADSWSAASEDIRSRGIASATRWLDALNWIGEKTDLAQEHAWPRTGIVGVADDELPPNLEMATCELAAMFVVNPNLAVDWVNGSASEQKRLKAGSVEIENFRNFFSMLGLQTAVPANVFALIQQWLGGGAADVGLGGVRSFDTDQKTGFKPPFGFWWGI